MSYWCEDNLVGFKYGGVYSNGSYFGCDYFAVDKKHYYRLFEFYGVCYMRKIKRGGTMVNRWRVTSLWDVEVMKSNLINEGCKINWENLDLIRSIFNEMSINGYGVSRNIDYCTALKVIPNK